jgi:peptidoglycan/LPS O-acetylase OafA/YrhL
LNERARFHRPELDLLRLAAFLLVFFHHALPQSSRPYLQGGFALFPAELLAAMARTGGAGVDLFFALSAYLITELLLREQRATGSVDVRAFYVRRILRIWPLYYFALLVLSPLAGERMPDGHFAAFVLMAGNWACAFWNYPNSAFALLWSVSIEEQFYLSWPWVVRRFGRRLDVWAAAMLVTATLARMLLVIAGTDTEAAVWCNTLARLDPIAAGVLLASQLEGRLPDLGAASRVRWIAGGTLLLFAGCGPAGALAGPASLICYPLLAAGSAMMLYGSLGAELGLGNRAWAAGIYLGKISFGLYVFHQMALNLVRLALQGRFGVLIPIAVALPITVILATLSYRLLESPFLRVKERFSRVSSRPV